MVVMANSMVVMHGNSVVVMATLWWSWQLYGGHGKLYGGHGNSMVVMANSMVVMATLWWSWQLMVVMATLWWSWQLYGVPVDVLYQWLDFPHAVWLRGVKVCG